MRIRWTPLLLIAALSISGRGQSPSQKRFALTPTQIAQAISASGIQTGAGQVFLLTRVVATEPQPALDVLSFEVLGRGSSAGHSALRSRVKLACHNPAECLPFYAIVALSQMTDGSVMVMTPAVSPAFKNVSSNANSEITMKAGTHATLIMDDDRSHIQVAVVSLENGMVGHRIHVASPDHKQIYVGEVVNAHLLKGSF
jgi:hypothetical protein